MCNLFPTTSRREEQAETSEAQPERGYEADVNKPTCQLSVRLWILLSRRTVYNVSTAANLLTIFPARFYRAFSMRVCRVLIFFFFFFFKLTGYRLIIVILLLLLLILVLVSSLVSSIIMIIVNTVDLHSGGGG